MENTQSIRPTSNCRLELTTPLTRLSDQDAKDAEQALNQWEAWREEADTAGVAFGDFLRQKLTMRARHVSLMPCSKKPFPIR